MKRFILLIGLIALAPAPSAHAQGATPPGLYVTDLKLSPPQPIYSQDIAFTATFSNTTSTVQNFRWQVHIYRADTPERRNNETTPRTTAFPVGAGDYPAQGTYRLGPTGYTCDFFFARVAWLDGDGKPTNFPRPDGQVFEKGFHICSPSVLPTATPAPTAVATPKVKPTSGLFVTDLRLSPDRPIYSQDISFNATFANSTDSEKTFKWLVYIFRADTPQRSNNETTAQTSAFPVGSREYSALGVFRYGPTGNTCDFFFARVGWMDADNKTTYFSNPDGDVFEKGFHICSPAVLPTSTPAPTAAPTTRPTHGPGLFVNDVQFGPARPAYNQDVSFSVNFSNTTGSEKSFNWVVYIYRVDAPARSNNETSRNRGIFPVGASESRALGTFRYGPTGYVCDFFFARVGWLDADNKTTFFTRANGDVFEKEFSVCSPSVIPTPTPAPVPTATPKPTPAPGLFVTDLRITPSQPEHNQPASFAATFSNSAGREHTFKWIVYIFRVDTPSRSNYELPAQVTAFPPGAKEYAAPGVFKYGATGFTCDFFFARVGWLDADNKITYFPKPDGDVFEKSFSICTFR